ncbi:MAG: hypothetical protein P8X78_05505, partial [Nitrosopumilaceae archaeon]
MNKKALIPVGIGIVAIMISASLMIPQKDEVRPESLSISYVDTNKELQSVLDLQQIRMSSPLKLNGFSIEQYCTFFSDDNLQNSIEYCTSTELLDSEGRYLGNIHMVGSPSEP